MGAGGAAGKNWAGRRVKSLGAGKRVKSLAAKFRQAAAGGGGGGRWAAVKSLGRAAPPMRHIFPNSNFSTPMDSVMADVMAVFFVRERTNAT